MFSRHIKYLEYRQFPDMLEVTISRHVWNVEKQPAGLMTLAVTEYTAGVLSSADSTVRYGSADSTEIAPRRGKTCRLIPAATLPRPHPHNSTNLLRR